MRVLPIAALVAAAMLIAPPAGLADEPGTADGALMLDDRPTALTHAYVIEVKELPEMHFGVGPMRYLKLLLTDRPFPDGQTPSDMLAHRLSFDGALRGVGFDIDSETGAVMSGRTLLPQEERPQFFSVVTLDTEPMVVLEDWAEAAGRLRGRVRTPAPLEVVNFDGAPGGPASFTVAATFDAPIVPAPVLAETIQGDAAKASPQAAIVRKFVRGVADGDAEAVRSVITADHPMQEMLTAEGLQQVRDMMVGAQDPDAFLQQLSKVYVYDSGQAVVVFQSDTGGASTFPVVQRDGAWLMDMP